MKQPTAASSSPFQKAPADQRERIARKNPERNSRLFALALARFLHSAEQVRRQQYGNDIDLAIIAETIAVGALEPKIRDPEFRLQYGDLREVVGTINQRGVNALSVAAATGIPRETTRRKIKQLVAMGVVVEKEPGNYIAQPGYLQSAPSLKVLAELEQAFIRLLNDCQNETFFEWPQARTGKRDPSDLAAVEPEERKFDSRFVMEFSA